MSTTYLDPFAPREEINRRIEANLTMDREAIELDRRERDVTQPEAWWDPLTPSEIGARFRNWADQTQIQTDKDYYLREAVRYERFPDPT